MLLPSLGLTLLAPALLIALQSPAPLLALQAPGVPAPAHDWPHWRGPARTNVSTEANWSSVGADEPLWRASIGTGYSVPMVADGRVFTVGYHASEEDPNVGEDEVACYDAVTGERRWGIRYASQSYANEHRGGVVGSPTVAGDTLLVASRQGELRALDVATGETRWEVDVVERHGVEPGRYGFSSSPYVDDDLVVVCMESVVAFDLATGETVWISENAAANYSTVASLELPGEDEPTRCYVAFGKNGVFALDADSGETVRRVDFTKSPRNVEGATPIVLGTDVFISSGYDQGGAFFDFAADPPTERWRSRRMRTKLAGTTFHDGCFYGYDESMLACLGLDGKLLWRERGLGQGALMIAGGRMLFTTSEGELVVAAASASGYSELSRAKVIDDGVFWAAPVLSNGLVYVRGSYGDLVCLDHRAPRDVATAAGPGASGAGDVDPAALETAYLLTTGIRAVTKKGLSMEGTLHVVALGLEDVAAKWELDAGSSRFHSSFDLPPTYPPGTIHTVFDGTHGWTVNPMRGGSLMKDAEVAQLRASDGNRTLLDPLPDGFDAKYAGRASFRGVDCHRVDVALDEERTRSVFFDVETGRFAGRTAADESTVILADWREIDGVWVPFKRTEFDPDQGLENRWTFTSAKLAKPEESLFEMPEAIAEQLEERKKAREVGGGDGDGGEGGV